MTHVRRTVAVVALIAVALVAMPVLTASGQSRAAAAFDKLRTLAGDWQGKAPDGKVVKVSYQLVSGGTALMETLSPAGEENMITMYHLNGDKLIVTHYCSAGNQPRMQAVVPEGEIRQLNFTYLDATNLRTPSEGRMQSLVVTFRDANHIQQEWTWREAGKDMSIASVLERVK